MSHVSIGAELLFSLLGGEEAIGRLIDLNSLPRKHREIEHKYRLQTSNGLASAMLTFTCTLVPVLEERAVFIENTLPFVGIDQYFVVHAHDDFRVSFRYRIGANRLPELTAKFDCGHDTNEIRGELNLDISNNDADSIRAILTVICRLSTRHTQFAVRQDGNVFKLIDGEFGKLEIVCYRVAGIIPAKPAVPFVEIESKEPDPEHAVAAIHTFEAALKLKKLRCHESISELFAPETDC